MKKLMGFVLILLVAMSSMAFAQAEKYDIGIFGDLAGTQTGITASAFVPFNFYAMAYDLDGEVKGYEFGVAIDPSITILSSVFEPSVDGVSTGLNLGDRKSVV